MYSSESIAIFIDTTNIVILEGHLLDLLTTEMSENICWLYKPLPSSVHLAFRRLLPSPLNNPSALYQIADRFNKKKTVFPTELANFPYVQWKSGLSAGFHWDEDLIPLSEASNLGLSSQPRIC